MKIAVSFILLNVSALLRRTHGASWAEGPCATISKKKQLLASNTMDHCLKAQQHQHQHQSLGLQSTLEAFSLQHQHKVAIPIRGGASPPSSTEIKQAKISFLADVVLGIATIAFLWVWQTNAEKFFSPYFLKHGFCNSPGPFTTQRHCAFFDWIVAALTLLVAASNGLTTNPTTLGNGVLYPLAHGAAHFLLSQTTVPPDTPISEPLQIAVLAIILAMGPAGVVGELIHKGYDNRLVLAATFLGLDGLLTWFFVSRVKYGVFALLYINIAINLLLFGSRVLLFNPYKESEEEEAVAFRIKMFGPRIGQSVASMVFMVLVMWIEPTQCGGGGVVEAYPGWFANIGGHIWFDVSLFFMAWVSLQNAIADKDSKPFKAFLI